MLPERPAVLVDSNSASGPRLIDGILWTIVVAYLIGGLLFPGFITPLLFPFALIHGTKRYGRKGIAVLVIATVIVITILETSSILNGFPLGHYYYTDLLGPKVGLIPIFVYLSYISLGYLAWVFATLLLGEVRRGSTLLATVEVPLLASFVMVAWDLSADPIGSTIKRAWIWTHGGSYFGVPVSNFVGWGFIVYVIFQIFAWYLRSSGSADLGRRLPRAHYLQVILVYMWTGFGFVLLYLTRPANRQVTDAAGYVWQTRAIFEASAISAIFTLIPISVLGLVVLFREKLTQKIVNGLNRR